ncbi:MAG: hypothetical protein LKK39_06680 [Oscillospiraceae bacterium]|jgi:hypothetical protein|nr:hypothetical protein [Oscillospiraceae bacterium]MCI2190686.1 hypothetical protein [Oscillospiraceae bacterium]MCI2206674.1 hypothetical protein [Oscillospiraceae bacterium]
MIKCPRCQALNPDGAKQCYKCGISLSETTTEQTLHSKFDPAQRDSFSPIQKNIQSSVQEDVENPISSSPNIESAKRPASLLFRNLAIISLVVGILVGLLLGSICKTVTMEDQVNYLLGTSSSSYSSKNYNNSKSYHSDNNKPVGSFNYIMMISVWGAFGALSAGLATASCHFKNQEKEINLLHNIDEKIQNRNG